MFLELNAHALPAVQAYVEAQGTSAFYVERLLECPEALTALFGLYTGKALEGVFLFGQNGVMACHYLSRAALGKIDLLRAIKHLAPTQIRGIPDQIEGIEQLLVRTVRELSVDPVQLMRFPEPEAPGANVPESKAPAADQEAFSGAKGDDSKTDDSKTDDSKAGYVIVDGVNAQGQQLVNDLTFLIGVETHFGRPVKSTGALLKSFKELIETDNYAMAVCGDRIVGQGFIESETSDRGVLAGIYVDPAYRGKGIGTAITHTLTEKLILRHKAAYLLVRERNIPGLKMYMELGYRCVEQFSTLTVDY